MEDLNYGHGGEPAQSSNADKTQDAQAQAADNQSGEAEAPKTSAQRMQNQSAQQQATQNEGQGMPDPAEREKQEVHVAEEPSGYRGDNWSTAGPGGTSIRSATPENAAGKINPSAPGDTGTTPGTTAN